MVQSIPPLEREMKVPQVFSMPAASPMFAPPPYEYQGNRQATIMFKTSPETLARLVPAPLQPNPEHIMGIYYGLLTIRPPSAMSYKEVGIFVPVAYGEAPGLYVAFLYLDTTVGIVCGREMWGFPKKDASITMTEERGEVSTVVSRFGFPLIKATMRPEARAEVIPAPYYQALFTLKVIPSIKRGAPPDVLQLTSTAVLWQTTELHTGPGTLELSTSPLDPLGDIPILGMAGARFEIYDMTLDYGEVAVDYLALH
jgi:acetoacetate decarboxylase